MRGTIQAALLRLDGLSCGQGGRLLVQDLSLTLVAGDHMAITGENGCGKSTLLRTLAGLHPRAGGRLYLDGREVRPGQERALLRRSAWVPQHQPRGRFPFLVNELLISSGDPAAATRAAEGLGLAGLEARALETLSGGQLQRVFLARALGQIAGSGPNGLLLVDEPTSALDFRGQSQVAALLAGLSATVVLVTHDRDLADRFPRRLQLLDGRAEVFNDRG